LYDKLQRLSNFFQKSAFLQTKSMINCGIMITYAIYIHILRGFASMGIIENEERYITHGISKHSMGLESQQKAMGAEQTASSRLLLGMFDNCLQFFPISAK
jgi:hypothetical protein